MINHKIFSLFFAILLLPSSIALAQSDGSAMQATSTPADATLATSTATTTSVTPATSTAAATSSATATTTKPVPTSTKPSPAPVSAAPASVTATKPSTSTATSTANIPVPDDEGNLLIRAVLVLLVAIPLGFLIAQLLKNESKKINGVVKKGEENEEGSKCFDIKKMLDDKLRELTDIKAKIESEAQSKIRETAHGVLRGSTADDMLILAEKAEKEYLRLKKLFEECQIEFGERVFRGTLIENSLSNKGILKKLKIEKTRKLEDWTLHDVLVQENKIPELSEYMADGPWYMHLWQEGKDEIKVIFKHKIFTIKASDKSTWIDTIAYAKTIGIPEEQLDFPIK